MGTLSNEIVKFAGGDTTFFDAFQDYYFHYNTANGRGKLGTFSEGITLEEKSKKIHNAFFAEVEKRSGISRDGNVDAWAANPNVIWAAFAVVNATINSVLPLTINPSIGRWTDLRFVDYGDVVHYRITPRTLYTTSLGAHGERTTFRQKKFDGDLVIVPKEHIVTVFTDMYRVLAGKEDLANFVRLVVISIETEMTRDAMNALNVGMAAGTYPAALSYTGAFDPVKLVQISETVQAYNFGSAPIIMGVSTALMKVLPDSTLGFREFVNGDAGSVMYLRDFYGYQLIQLPQVSNGNYTDFGLAMDPNTLYIVSPAMDKLVKGVVSNTLTNSNQFYDNADITQNFTMRKDWDFQFASAAFGGMYKITD